MISAALMLFANTLLFTLRLDRGSSFPRPLSAAEERSWLERLSHGDSEARSVLIEHNLRLVAHIVKKYYSQNSEQDDLISIGTIGLIKAISSFDPAKGARLATYSARCIENEILMYFRAQKSCKGKYPCPSPLNLTVRATLCSSLTSSVWTIPCWRTSMTATALCGCGGWCGNV